MKVVSYFFVGATAAIVDIAVFGILVKIFSLPWFPVAIFSFILATTVNYALSVRFVFESQVRFSRQQEMYLVFFVSAIGLFFNQLFLWLFIEQWKIDELLANLMASAAVFFWNYLSRRTYIFRKQT